MRIAITGATGFVGRYLQEELLRNGHELIPLDRSTGWDITDKTILDRLPAFDTIVHLAARSFVPDSYKEPYSFYETNTTGTLNMLEAARRNNAGLVYISSYVYGRPEYQPINEEHRLDPFNPYAQSKILAEDLCRAYNRDFNVPVTILRPFNIYGPGQPVHFLLPKIICQAIGKEEIVLFDPRPKRDFVHVKDVARAIAAAVRLSHAKIETVNIGYGKSHSIEEVCNIVESLCGYGLNIRYLHQYRPNEILDTICDNHKAAKILDWRPQIDMKEGLGEMIHYYEKSVC